MTSGWWRDSHLTEAFLCQVRVPSDGRTVAKPPRLLTPEQRDQFARVPADLSARELGRYYTFSQHDLDVINRHRQPANRLGFAVQLGLLRFPGRSPPDVPEVPERVLTGGPLGDR